MFLCVVIKLKISSSHFKQAEQGIQGNKISFWFSNKKAKINSKANYRTTGQCRFFSVF